MARVLVEVPPENDQGDSVIGAETNSSFIEADEVSQHTSDTGTNGPHPSSYKSPPNIFKKINPKAFGILVIMVVVISLLIFLIKDRQSLRAELSQLENNPQLQSENEAETLKQEISQFYEVPEDEVPTVATVVDATKVKNQSFFKNSQNGDKVLLFSNAGKAILYRPSTKKIIEVAPINLGESTGDKNENNVDSNPIEVDSSTNN